MSYKCVFNIFLNSNGLFIFVFNWNENLKRQGRLQKRELGQAPWNVSTTYELLTVPECPDQESNLASSVEGKDFATELSIWASNGLLLNSENMYGFCFWINLKISMLFPNLFTFFSKETFYKHKKTD